MVARTWFFVALGLFGSGVHSPTAATVTFTPEVAAILNPDFSPVDPAFILPGDRLAPRDESYLLQVNARLRLSELGDLLGIQSTGFDVQVNDDGAVYFAPELGLPAWTAWNPIIDTNGPAPGGGTERLWIINRDGGGDPNDLIRIDLVGATTNFGPIPFDIRRTIGQSVDNEVAGTFFVELPATPGYRASVDILTPYESRFYDANGAVHLGTAIGLSTATYSVVPELASWMLLSIGAALTLLARGRFNRRR